MIDIKLISFIFIYIISYHYVAMFSLLNYIKLYYLFFPIQIAIIPMKHGFTT